MRGQLSLETVLLFAAFLAVLAVSIGALKVVDERYSVALLRESHRAASSKLFVAIDSASSFPAGSTLLVDLSVPSNSSLSYASGALWWNYSGGAFNHTLRANVSLTPVNLTLGGYVATVTAGRPMRIQLAADNSSR